MCNVHPRVEPRGTTVLPRKTTPNDLQHCYIFFPWIASIKRKKEKGVHSQGGLPQYANFRQRQAFHMKTVLNDLTTVFVWRLRQLS
ncbi:hypothetical protein GQ457_12G011250 [Hibiscus cannabinus]